MAGAQVAEYFQAYARHFQLERHIRFKTTVRRVLRDQLDRGWNVHVTEPDGDVILHFDKVVFGTGSDTVPVWPPMPGEEMFKGAVMHAQSYRRYSGLSLHEATSRLTRRGQSSLRARGSWSSGLVTQHARCHSALWGTRPGYTSHTAAGESWFRGTSTTASRPTVLSRGRGYGSKTCSIISSRGSPARCSTGL